MKLQVFTLGSNFDNENEYHLVSNSEQLKILLNGKHETPINLTTQFSVSRSCSSHRCVFQTSVRSLNRIKHLDISHFLIDVFFCSTLDEEEEEGFSDEDPCGLITFTKRCLKILDNTEIIVSPSNVILYDIMEEEFRGTKRFHLANTYVENRIIRNSTLLNPVNTFDTQFPKPFVNGKFSCFLLMGSIGLKFGSYDSDKFLERFHEFLKTVGADNIHVIFANNIGTYRYQFPLTLALEEEVHSLCLYENKDVDPLKEDLACDLHDSIRLKKIHRSGKKNVRVEIILTKLKWKVK